MASKRLLVRASSEAWLWFPGFSTLTLPEPGRTLTVQIPASCPFETISKQNFKLSHSPFDVKHFARFLHLVESFQPSRHIYLEAREPR